ncbi:mechanosensitive ion channel protein 3, chloroplastic-like isoform X2 [Tripterygium wilfordii]|uniref:mechanosensitive ion channel protein 3, chloroplastic-like isoform X2 n=1 Tax=Tripterygium wilfordii TaxID=458696 RepID=UPI0018F85417|nr:mechanosensitive ion channel protein 3, chloroplastic-like isoform X2 [Tripterygium wilfordii]
MTCAGSIKFSRELRICGYHGCSYQHTSLSEKERRHSVSINLSSYAVDAWSLNLLNSVHGPINPVYSRCKVFLCRSVLLPGGGNEIPFLKSAAVVLSRSYGYLCKRPLVLRLIPAVGIIAFAAWGLGPLMRFGRIVFLRKTDNSWKKSSTHYVLTSYLQPLLLWSGAILICRALDPIMLPTEASHAVKQRLLNFVRSLSSVMAFAYCLSSLIQQVQKFLAETNDSSDTRNVGFDFAGKSIYTAVWVAAVSLFMELLGFSTQKWLTAGGLGTVLLTLAGREIFTNFLSSVMIHATRPFVVNEWIQTKIEGYEVSGTVEHVGWWSPTIIRGDDREAVHIPNHKFTVNVVRNLSQKTHWRIKTYFAISHLDVNKINNIVADMRKVLAKNHQVEQQRLHRRVFLENINPESQALMVLVSCFVKTSHFEEYLCVKEAIILDLLRVISHHRARLATPIRTIQKVYSEADLENVPFSEMDFTRSRAAAHRPFLLIEPSYKINGDDKAKNVTRSVLTNEENAKVKATSTSESKEDAKSSPVLNPDSKDDKVLATSTSKSGVDSHVSPTQASNSQAWNSMADGSAEMQDPVENGDVLKDNVQIISEGTTIEEGTSQKTSATNQESGGGRTDGSSAMSHSKQIIEKSTASSASMARPPLEDNIVLGVALEGSKRVLPIEEEMVPSIFAQPKELAAHRNGNGSPPAVKDTKDGQMPADQQD